MKKALYKVLCAMLAATMLAGGGATKSETGKAESEKKGTEEKSEGSESSKVISEESGKLKVMVMTEAEDRKKIMDGYYVKYKEAFPNLEVEFDEQVKTYADKLKVYCSSGEMPDVFWCYDETPIITDNVLDLTVKIVEDGFVKKYTNDAAFIPYSDGRLYAVGAGNDTYFIPTVWYNKAIFEDLGLSEPQTYDEFVELCKKLKEKEYIPMSMSSWAASEMLLQILITVDDAEAPLKLIRKETGWADPAIKKGVDRLMV